MKCIGEMSFRTEVKAVKLKGDRIVVVCDAKIFVYNLSDLKFLEYIDTSPNPLGLCSINTIGDHTTIAAPDKELGQIVINFSTDKKKKTIRAHQSALNCLQLNADGTLVATASQKGTIIRIFNTQSGERLQELRRGSEYAQIYSAAFDLKNTFLAISSDSGTIHLFCIKALGAQQQQLQQQQQKQQQEVQQGKNPKSVLQFMSFMLPYFDAEWSFAQFKVQDSKTKVAFGAEENTLIIISYDGNYYKITFDPINGGDCQKQEEKRIMGSI